MEARSQPAPPRPARLGALVAAIVGVVVLVFALLAYGETRYRSCIAKASAEYPAIPVSAFTGRATGPLKVSYVRERAAALDDCGRFF